MRAEQLKLQEQVSSGKRVSRPSDDPDAYARIARIDFKTQGIDSYTQRVEAVKTRMTVAEDALFQMSNILVRARELTVQGLNGSQNEGDRKLIAQELQGIREHFVQLGASEVDDQYVFSGVKSNVAAIAEDGSYQGGPEGALVEVGEGIKVDVAINGGAIFDGEVNVIGVLDDIIARFEGGDLESGDDMLVSLQKAEDQVSRGHTRIGARLNRVILAEDLGEEIKLSLAEERQSLADADLADTISRMLGLEQSLQAAVQVSQSSLQPSLLQIL